MGAILPDLAEGLGARSEAVRLLGAVGLAGLVALAHAGIAHAGNVASLGRRASGSAGVAHWSLVDPRHFRS